MMTEEQEYIEILERNQLPLDHPLIERLEANIITDRSFCKSCGRQWTDHGGITVTCAENARLRGVMIKALETYHQNGCDGKAGARAMLIIREEIGINY